MVKFKSQTNQIFLRKLNICSQIMFEKKTILNKLFKLNQIRFVELCCEIFLNKSST